MSTLHLKEVAPVPSKNPALLVWSREWRHFLAHGDEAKCPPALSADRNMHQKWDLLHSLNVTPQHNTEGSLMASSIKTKTMFLFAWVAWFHNQYYWAYFVFFKVRFLYLKTENLWCYNICQNASFLFHASLHLQFESNHLDSTLWCFLLPTAPGTLR